MFNLEPRLFHQSHLAIHFLTLKQEYMTMTTDNITPIAVRFE